MPKILVKEKEHKIQVPIMLTAVSGKIRIKNRSILNEYGTPVATRKDGFALNNYVEWQIGYDVVKKKLISYLNHHCRKLNLSGQMVKPSHFTNYQNIFGIFISGTSYLKRI